MGFWSWEQNSRQQVYGAERGALIKKKTPENPDGKISSGGRNHVVRGSFCFVTLMSDVVVMVMVDSINT